MTLQMQQSVPCKRSLFAFAKAWNYSQTMEQTMLRFQKFHAQTSSIVKKSSWSKPPFFPFFLDNVIQSPPTSSHRFDLGSVHSILFQRTWGVSVLNPRTNPYHCQYPKSLYFQNIHSILTPYTKNSVLVYRVKERFYEQNATSYRSGGQRCCKCVAVCCSILQCVTVCCSVLHCGTHSGVLEGWNYSTPPHPSQPLLQHTPTSSSALFVAPLLTVQRHTQTHVHIHTRIDTFIWTRIHRQIRSQIHGQIHRKTHRKYVDKYSAHVSAKKYGRQLCSTRLCAGMSAQQCTL